MNNIKTVFSIKDLENLSGIKAHTIRIWEKRYNVLQPTRTGTNIRVYSLASLQKLLNITLLHNHGYKISKIAKFPPEKIPQLVKEITSRKNANNHAINAFKLATVNFDQAHFLSTYHGLLFDKSFREVFYEVFIPLLDELGILWQTDTITPAQEHFISFLIKQKIILNTERIQSTEPIKDDRVFVLYLPMNEIHELGLMYINYELLLAGCKTIYLGESVPAENLRDLHKHFDNIVFVTYLTVQPSNNHIDEYLQMLSAQILAADSKLWILGRQTRYIDRDNLTPKISIFDTIQELVQQL
jgi:DNA-binding transcriptional MerR regulator